MALAVDGAETQFVMDQIGLAQVLVEISGTERITYAYGLARLWQDKGEGTTEWFLGDALGSVRQLVDDNGDVILARDYSPYGQVLAEDGTGSTGYGFAGEQFAGYRRRNRSNCPIAARLVNGDVLLTAIIAVPSRAT